MYPPTRLTCGVWVGGGGQAPHGAPRPAALVGESFSLGLGRSCVPRSDSPRAGWGKKTPGLAVQDGTAGRSVRWTLLRGKRPLDFLGTRGGGAERASHEPQGGGTREGRAAAPEPSLRRVVQALGAPPSPPERRHGHRRASRRVADSL